MDVEPPGISDMLAFENWPSQKWSTETRARYWTKETPAPTTYAPPAPPTAPPAGRVKPRGLPLTTRRHFHPSGEYTTKTVAAPSLRSDYTPAWPAKAMVPAAYAAPLPGFQPPPPGYVMYYPIALAPASATPSPAVTAPDVSDAASVVSEPAPPPPKPTPTTKAVKKAPSPTASAPTVSKYQIDVLEAKLYEASYRRSGLHGSHAQARALNEAFKKFDLIGSGKIALPEFFRAMERFGLHVRGERYGRPGVGGVDQKVAVALFEKYANGGSSIAFKEFTNAFLKSNSSSSDEAGWKPQAPMGSTLAPYTYTYDPDGDAHLRHNKQKRDPEVGCRITDLRQPLAPPPTVVSAPAA